MKHSWADESRSFLGSFVPSQAEPNESRVFQIRCSYMNYTMIELWIPVFVWRFHTCLLGSQLRICMVNHCLDLCFFVSERLKLLGPP